MNGNLTATQFNFNATVADTNAAASLGNSAYLSANLTAPTIGNLASSTDSTFVGAMNIFADSAATFTDYADTTPNTGMQPIGKIASQVTSHGGQRGAITENLNGQTGNLTAAITDAWTSGMASTDDVTWAIGSKVSDLGTFAEYLNSPASKAAVDSDEVAT